MGRTISPRNFEWLVAHCIVGHCVLTGWASTRLEDRLAASQE